MCVGSLTVGTSSSSQLPPDSEFATNRVRPRTYGRPSSSSSPWSCSSGWRRLTTPVKRLCEHSCRGRTTPDRAVGVVTMIFREALKGGFHVSAQGRVARWPARALHDGHREAVPNSRRVRAEYEFDNRNRQPTAGDPSPTMILWGANDRFQLVEYRRRLADDIPAARFEPIPRARHFIRIDRPRVVVGLLEEFSCPGALKRIRWRGERDSNPRYPSGYSGFQDHRHRPLGHPSAEILA